MAAKTSCINLPSAMYKQSMRTGAFYGSVQIVSHFRLGSLI